MERRGSITSREAFHELGISAQAPCEMERRGSVTSREAFHELGISAQALSSDCTWPAVHEGLQWSERTHDLELARGLACGSRDVFMMPRASGTRRHEGCCSLTAL